MTRALPHPLRLGLAALGIGALVSGCARGPTSADEGPIRVGVVMPQTGSLGEDGQKWIEAIRLATEEVNAAGGPLPGRPVELVMLDSRTDSATAVEAATRAVNESGVVAIIGDAGSDGTLAIYDAVTGPGGIPQVSCCATSPTLTERMMSEPPEERFFFRVVPSDARQAQVVARIARNMVTGATIGTPCSRMAIVYMNDTYGAPFAQAIAASFRARGGGDVVEVPYTDGRSSYSAEARQIVEADPACVALVSYPETAGTILRDYLSLAPPGRDPRLWIGTDGLRSDAFVRQVGASVLARLDFFGASPITQPPGPAYDGFAAAHRAVFSEDPGLFVSNNYDAAALLYLGIARAGSTSGRAVMEGVRSLGDPDGEVARPGGLASALQRIRAGGRINYNGASGPVDVDALGDVRGDYEVWQVSDDGGALAQVATVQSTELE